MLGDLSALAAIPRTLVKRARLRSIRKLSSSEVRELIMDNRISLRDLTGKAAIR
jgi:hypothetical protein